MKSDIGGVIYLVTVEIVLIIIAAYFLYQIAAYLKCKYSSGDSCLGIGVIFAIVAIIMFLLPNLSEHTKLLMSFIFGPVAANFIHEGIDKKSFEKKSQMIKKTEVKLNKIEKKIKDLSKKHAKELEDLNSLRKAAANKRKRKYEILMRRWRLKFHKNESLDNLIDYKDELIFLKAKMLALKKNY